MSRGSVREAIRILEHIGLLEVRNGIGTFVRPDGLSKASLLRLEAAAIGDDSPLDIIVARRALEPICASLAARDHTEHDLFALQTSVEDQAQLVLAGEDTQQIDLSFHRAVAAASHNPVLELLVERLTEIMNQGTWRELKQRSRLRDGGAGLFLKQHRRILGAIKAGDEDGAAGRMGDHLDSIEASLLAEVDR